MTGQLALLANIIISVAYFAICCAILAPLLRAGQVRSNRLGTATAAIFFSCAVGHGLHAYSHAAALIAGDHDMDALSGYAAGWDLVTAAIAVNYWTMRRTYGALMKGASLFDDLQQQQRLAELEHREALAAAQATADREREAQARMLSALIANSQSLVYVKDLQGRYLLANLPFLQAFSVTESELLGRDDTFLDPELAPVWRVNDLRAQREEFALEEWSDAADGRHYYESMKFPLYDPAGAVYATCGVSLDVTERRRATAEITRARDAALAATAAKSAFLATMSHEIRTPMNAVIGLTGLLLETELDEQQRDLVETVRGSGDALLIVINDILDFSKIEAGELQLESAPFDLRTCAEAVLDLVAPTAAAKRLDVVLDIAPDCPQQVLGDQFRLRQVLLNLVGNAVKFTATGEVLLSLTALPAGAGHVTLQVAVRDSGIGIPADALSRLFRPFTQVDDSTTRTYGGSGLGLAISRRLVRAMGGELQVDSVEGEGSTFRFEIPLPVSAGNVPAQPAPRAAVPLAGRSVLIVDDNATNRRVLDRQLAGWQLRTTAATGAAEALALVQGGARFDLAVLDVHMPEMDGVQLAAELRQLPGTRDLPLVLLTSMGHRPKGAGRENVAYLTKPVKLAALRVAVQAVLSGGAEDADSGPGETPAPVTAGGSGSLRVLLAEDNLVNQKVAGLMLARLGHRVDTVGDGAQALAAVRDETYDVVLMDVHMPVMDGLEATRHIRSELPVARQPRIVALSASVLQEDRDACAEAGMDDYLPKPVRTEELGSMLRGVTSPTTGGSFDPAVLDALVQELGGAGTSLREDLLANYLREGDSLIADLLAGARAGDPAAVRRAAHALRSSSSTVGLEQLALLLAQAEAAAVRGGPDVGAAAEAAGRAYRTGAGAIKDFLRGARSGVPAP